MKIVTIHGAHLGIAPYCREAGASVPALMRVTSLLAPTEK